MKRVIDGFWMSLSMFSILPAPRVWNERALGFVVVWLPVVGFLIGSVTFGIAHIQLPLMVKAALLLVCPLILSGFIHVDGYMDTSDAIFSRTDLTRRREILKDSHVGAFAVIMFGVYGILGFAAIYSGLEVDKSLWVFIFAPIVSRCIAGITLLLGQPFSAGGFGEMFRQGNRHLHLILLFGMIVVSLYFGFALYLLAMLIVGMAIGTYLVCSFKGVSGDLCGFLIIVSELSAWIVWAVM